MRKLTQRDENQISGYEHDETSDAKRVTIVGGDFGLAEVVKEALKDLKIEVPTTATSYPRETFTIEKEVIVKEYELLKIPEIIREYKTIEIPVTVIETKIVEVPKPIIMKEIELRIVEIEKIVERKEIKDLDGLLKKLMILQAITLGMILIKLFI